MAARNSSRGTRLSGRSGGNRPRTHPTAKPRRKPAPPKPPKLRKDARPPYISPTQVLRETRDGMPTTELQMIRVGLETASAVIAVCATALEAQAADSDADIAIVLHRCVISTLERQADRIDSLLKGGEA